MKNLWGKICGEKYMGEKSVDKSVVKKLVKNLWEKSIVYRYR